MRVGLSPKTQSLFILIDFCSEDTPPSQTLLEIDAVDVEQAILGIAVAQPEPEHRQDEVFGPATAC